MFVLNFLILMFVNLFTFINVLVFKQNQPTNPPLSACNEQRTRQNIGY